MSQIIRVFANLTLGVLAASFGHASAAELELAGGAPHLCAVVEGSKTANGTPVIAYSCAGGPQDQWNYVYGQLEGIGTANGKSMCLDVKGQGTSPGTLVDLWPCNGQLNQQWQLIDGEVYGVQSGACLDSSGGPTVGGGKQLIINTCNNKASQDWVLRSAQFELSASAPFLCVTVSGGDTASGTPVITYSCHDEPAQLWNYIGGQGQIQGLGTTNASSTCLTAGAGNLVTLSPCNGSTDQAWALTNQADFGTDYGNSSQIILLGTVSTLCLDSAGGPSVGGGTQLVVNACSGAMSQNWNVR